MREKILDILCEYHGNTMTDDEAIDKILALFSVRLTLPSDEEIKTKAIYDCGGCSSQSIDERYGFRRGAKWMRAMIKKQIGNEA